MSGDLRAIAARLIAAEHEYREAIKDAQEHGGRLILDARRRLGLTQRELAAYCSVTSSYLSKVEHGENVPSKALLQKVAELLANEEAE